jgi:NADH-quinone oxidoreductase subunit C
MTAQDIHAKLKAKFGDAVGELTEAKIDPFVTVKADKIVEICRFAKAEAGLDFDYCEDVTGIDWPARNLIEIVYHLFSLQHRHQLVLKVETERSQPCAPSVESVWKAANWLEREVYDMLGVDFTGHPDLRRILLPDDWIGHPLRKDYQEAGGYHGVTNTRFDPLVRLTQKVEEERKAIAAAAPAPVPVSAPAPAPAPAPVPAPAPAPAPVPATVSAPAKKEEPSG